MPEFYYTSEKNVQIVIALLKAHGIKNVVASPGTTNITFMMSIRHDPFFKLYSAPDERSAAYIACGMAAESGAPVAITCTGATASRNYSPGLTEAFYRKLPVLAVTSTQHVGRIGNAIPQVIDRSQLPKDIAKCSILIPAIHSQEDEWAANLSANKAILELFHHGGGPVHINLETTYSRDFSVQELPAVRVIHRYHDKDKKPLIPAGKRLGVFIGSHRPWTAEETEALDAFCSSYNAAVFCDLTSNYHGKFRCDFSLVKGQIFFYGNDLLPEFLIHIGEVSGGYETYGITHGTAEIWRVNPDGEIRDTFRKLTAVFEMEESDFFREYSQQTTVRNEYATRCQAYCRKLHRQLEEIPDLPFSNLWIARNTAHRLPENSVLHLGILNSLRSWNLLGRIPKSVVIFSNTGGFGIDGGLSSLLGGSLATPGKLHFCVIGDLAFFYDMNVLGNRHVSGNLRIMLINNGNGTEFRNYNHPASIFGENAGEFIAAEGHYGRKSPELVRHYAQDLGFEYLTASDKNSYLSVMEHFLSPEAQEKPMLLEVFTDSKNESDALYAVESLVKERVTPLRQLARQVLSAEVRHKVGNALRRLK